MVHVYAKLCFLCVVGELQELCMSSKQVECLCLCLSVCVCVYVYVCLSVGVMCLSMCVCMCKCVYMCVYLYICMYVCLRLCICACTCVFYMTHCYHVGWPLIMLVNRCHLWCYSTLWVSCIAKNCMLSIHSIVSLTHVSKDFTIYGNIIYTISTCIMLHHHHCFIRLCGAVLSSVAASNDDYHWTTNE